MASKARFGRIPRAAPSLTSTIVALAQQYQNGLDTNIEGAWTNGGLFEGHHVTDKEFIAHWKDRMQGVSKDDPMWDFYNQKVHNYEFQIAESKMGQKYAEKKVSDGAMAGFYTSWAKKLPADSEAYRNLMTKAAQFRAAAASRAAGGRSRAAGQAYVNAQMATYNRDEKPYETMTSILSRYAVEYGILDAKDITKPDHGFSKLTNAAGENDPLAFASMLNDLSGNKEIMGFLKQHVPGFSGSLNAQTLTAMANNARNGATIRYNRAVKAGRKGDATDAGKAIDARSLDATVIALSLGGKTPHSSFVEQDNFQRGLMDGVLAADSGATPMQRQAAIDKYHNWLAGQGSQLFLKSLPAGALDPTNEATYNPTAAGVAGRIQGTLSALSGVAQGQTTKDDLLGFGTDAAGPSSDAATLAATTSGLQAGLANVAAGTSIIVRTDSANASAKPDPNGSHWGIFAAGDAALTGLTLVPTTIPVQTQHVSGKNVINDVTGETRYEVATPVSVKVWSSRDPNTGGYTGQQIKPAEGADPNVGFQVTIPGWDGIGATQYGAYVNGALVWTHENLFANPNPGQPPAVPTNENGKIVYNSTLGAAPTATPATGVNAPPPFDPQSYVNHSMISHNPTVDPKLNPTFDPTDKQLGWDSPLASFAHTSQDNGRYVANLGDVAINKMETGWFSDPNHYTPAMRQQIANGAAPEDVVTTKANELVQVMDWEKTWGYTPEEQSAMHSFVQARGQAFQAQQGGFASTADYLQNQTRLADDGRRQILQNQLSTWAQPTPAAQAPVGSLAFGPAFPTQPTPGGQLPQGWSVADLLNQPGMSLGQANDLVAQITNGALGQRLPGQVTPAPFPYAGTGTPTGLAAGTRSPYQNPFMPAAGVRPYAGKAGNVTPQTFAPPPAYPTPPAGNTTPQFSAPVPRTYVPPKVGNQTPQDFFAPPVNLYRLPGSEQQQTPTGTRAPKGY